MVARGRWWGLVEMGKSSQKVQTSCYKISKAWGYNIQPLIIVNNVVLYMKVSKIEDLKSFIIREKYPITMYGNRC